MRIKVSEQEVKGIGRARSKIPKWVVVGFVICVLVFIGSTGSIGKLPDVILSWAWRVSLVGVVSLFIFNKTYADRAGGRFLVEQKKLTLFTMEEIIGEFLEAGVSVQDATAVWQRASGKLKGADTKNVITSDEEVAVALAELQVEGVIEYVDDLRFRLTCPKGLDYAEKLLYAHVPKERVVMFMYTAGVDNIGEALQGDS